jgi:serine/threonine-protein kinase HipA
MISNRECYVYIVLPGQTDYITAGKLVISETASGEAIGRFVYGKSYLANPGAVPVDPATLKLSDKVYETGLMQGMFGAIRDATPDYWGRMLIERYTGRIDLSEMDYLLYSPDDRIGALGFGNNQQPPAPKRTFNQIIDLGQLQSVADEVLSGTGSPDTLHNRAGHLLKLGTSMGGARPKAVVSDDDALWIAKFNSDNDRYNNALVEHAMLILARDCGISVAMSRVTKVGEKDVLLVKRFDRQKSDAGYLRHRMVSALTVLQIGDDMAHRNRWSYIAFAEELRKFSSEPKKDTSELFRRMVFNALISNTDDHPRNHAFIAKRNWRLAPAYDLTPMPAVSLERRDLAMICGRRGRIATEENLLSECRRFLLEPDEAVAIVNDMVKYIKENWYRTARGVGLSDEDCKKIQGAFVYPDFFAKR